MTERYDFLFKYLVIGNAGVGKSCVLHQFVERKFKPNSMHTIGVEFQSRCVQLSGGSRTAKLQIWDTAGQERFRAVTRSYYRGAAGCALVYDVTCRDSYTQVADWLADARQLAGSNLCVALLGNKRDLAEENAALREVTEEEAAQFARENGIDTQMEVSALSGENVERAFLEITRQIVARIDQSAAAAAPHLKQEAPPNQPHSQPAITNLSRANQGGAAKSCALCNKM